MCAVFVVAGVSESAGWGVRVIADTRLGCFGKPYWHKVVGEGGIWGSTWREGLFLLKCVQ